MADPTQDAWAMFADWEKKWADDIEDVHSFSERTAVYAYMNKGIDIDLAKAMAKSDYAPR